MKIQELFSLNNKVALVVGGAGKIGFPMAEALAEAGAKVYIGSTNKENYTEAALKLTNMGLNAVGIEIDQSNEESVTKARDTIHKNGDKISILVNSGVSRPMKDFTKSKTDDWDYSMDVNARGLFITCREFIKDMLELNEGKIINLASIYGLVAPDMWIYENVNFETEPDYPYTKGGMIMYTKYLASYYATKNITANCIAPGGFFNNQPKEFLERYLMNVPMRRMAYHDDLKGTSVFLASKASDYVTGQVISIDGGLTII